MFARLKGLLMPVDTLKVTSTDFGIDVFGHNADIDAAETIWGQGGLFPWAEIGTNETTAIVSTSANDTSNGTGAQTVEVEGLVSVTLRGRTGLQIKRETKTLNGVTPVVLSNFYAFVYRIHVETYGSGNANAGDITVTHGADVILQMEAGENISECAVMVVPHFTSSGAVIHGASLLNIYARSERITTAVTDIAIMHAHDDLAFHAIFRGAVNANAPIEHYNTLKQRYEPGTRFELRATDVSSASQNVAGGFSLVYDIG